MADKRSGKKAEADEVRAAFVTDNATAAFEHFLGVAARVPTDDLAPSNIDPAVARVNARIALESVRARRAIVDAKLRDFDWHSVEELPALLDALEVAVGRVAEPASTGEIQRRLAEVRPWRANALKQLEVLAFLGLVPEERVLAIRAGSGSYDTARDAVDIVQLFTDYEATVAGRHAFTAAHLEKLGRDGNWLVQNIRPTGSRQEPAATDPAAILRDQLAFLVEERYALLREAGAVAFGVRRLDEHVPALHSRALPPRNRATPEPADPGGKPDGNG